MKNIIMKSMVALLLLWGTAACTDEVLVDMEKPGIENNSPEAGRITSLKNILPKKKPKIKHISSLIRTIFSSGFLILFQSPSFPVISCFSKTRI